MMRAAASLRRPAVHVFSSSQAGPATTPGLGRLLQHFPSASSPSPSASSPWTSLQQQQPASSPIARSSPLPHVPSRSYGSRSAPTATTKRHLYVVLAGLGSDYGFDIHKVDMDDDDDDLDGHKVGTPLLRRLPEPPAFRIGTGGWTQFAALGSNIVAMGNYPRPAKEGERSDYPCYDSVTAIYDTETAELATSELLPVGLAYSHRVVAIGNSLYAFESTSDKGRCSCCNVVFTVGLHCLRADAAADKLWQWQPLPNSPRFSWSCNDPVSELPFDAEGIRAYAVHPRGRTLFVSAGGAVVAPGTFAYGTGSGKWKRCCGTWNLPFRGQGHYDAYLDAWVSLRRLHSNNFELDDLRWETSKTTDGHLCACRITSVATASLRHPEMKVSKETLLREDPPGWRRLESRLVHMADRREYCLLEHLVGSDATCVLRLSPFRAKYGEDGELVATAHRPTRSYEVPGYDDGSDTQAFWI